MYAREYKQLYSVLRQKLDIARSHQMITVITAWVLLIQNTGH